MDELKVDLKLILNAIKDPVFVHDSNFNVIYANDAYINITNKPIHLVLNYPYWKSFPIQSGPLVGCIEALKTHCSVTEKIYCHCNKVYQSRTFPVKDSNNQIIYSVHIFEDITAMEEKSKKLLESDKILQKNYLNTISSISSAIEHRDPYTAGHQYRVAHLASAIAVKMKLSKDVVKGIYLGALIHDIGKIQIPAEILSSPRKLLEEEFSLIKRHPIFGCEIIKSVSFPWPLDKIIEQHHERLDGSGYPYGLKAKEITLEAQIVGVADVFEALTSHRPYRPRHKVSEAISELKNGIKTKYNEDAVLHCIHLIRNENFQFPK